MSAHALKKMSHVEVEPVNFMYDKFFGNAKTNFKGGTGSVTANEIAPLKGKLKKFIM